jgi:hypothetical protein
MHVFCVVTNQYGEELNFMQIIPQKSFFSVSLLLPDCFRALISKENKPS